MLANLLQRADQIAAEQQDSANTAPRVGSFLRDLALALAMPYDPAASYVVNQLAYFSGRLVQCISPTTAGQSPTTAPKKWTDFTITTADIDVNGPDQAVTGQKLAEYVVQELNARLGNTEGLVVPYADETTPGIVKRADLDTMADPDNNSLYMTPQLVITLVQQLLATTGVSVTLDQAAQAGSITNELLTLNGGVAALSWETADSANQVVVLKLVNGLLKLAAMDATKLGGGSGPVDTPVVWTWTVGDDYELVDELTRPAAPTNLIATQNIQAYTNCDLSFSDNSDNEASFEVEGTVGDPVTGPWDVQSTLGENQTGVSFRVGVGSQWYFRAWAKNSIGRSLVPSNTVSFRIAPAETVLNFQFYRTATGSNPAILSTIESGKSYTRLAAGQNFAVKITDQDGAIPTGAYDGLLFSLYEKATGRTYGWTAPDYNIKPSGDLVLVSPPAGSTYELSGYTIGAIAYKGPVRVKEAGSDFALIAPVSSVIILSARALTVTESGQLRTRLEVTLSASDNAEYRVTYNPIGSGNVTTAWFACPSTSVTVKLMTELQVYASTATNFRVLVDVRPKSNTAAVKTYNLTTNVAHDWATQTPQ